MSYNPNTQAERAKGIGGSDIPVIIGLYDGAVALCLEKQGRKPRPPLDSEAVHFGTVLEGIVAEEFTRRTGKALRRINKTITGANDWERANIDRRVLGEEMPTGLEIKTTSAFSDAWDDGPSEAALVQSTWYMRVTGWKRWYIAVLIGGQSFKHFLIEYDPALAAMLWDKANTFWQHVLAGTTPEPVCTADIETLYSGGGAAVEANADTYQHLVELRQAKADRQRAEKVEAAAKLKVQRFMGDADALTVNGIVRATWKGGKRKIIDSKQLRLVEPEIAERFTKVSECRVFRLS